MLRSVSHRFALVKLYLLDRFAFGFRVLAVLNCIALALPCQHFCVSRLLSLASAARFLCCDGLTVARFRVTVNPFMLRYSLRLQHARH